MERIGILGGTFNPIHNGHVNMALGFLKRLELDRVILIPVWSPPHKSAHEIVPAYDRLEMCRLACLCNEKLTVSDIEIRREGKSYTVDTLHQLKKIMPRSRFFLITGADMFITLDEWKDYREIMKLAALCACSRKEGELLGLRDCARKFESECGAECHIEDFQVTDVSSTQVRNLLRNGADVSDLLPEPVLDYIKEKGLYRT